MKKETYEEMIKALEWYYICDRKEALRYLNSNSELFNEMILEQYRESEEG